jgi:hypothetical protein
MLLRSDDSPLCGSDNGNRVFLTERFLDLVDRTCFSKGKSGSVFGAEENVYIRKNGFNAFSCFLSSPEV